LGKLKKNDAKNEIEKIRANRKGLALIFFVIISALVQHFFMHDIHKE
jgi:hypothetical protein